MDNKDTISTLNNLIETLRDGQQGFSEAADNANNIDLKSYFREIAAMRGRFVSTLQKEVTRLGGDPEKSGSVAGAMHRAWIDIMDL